MAFKATEIKRGGLVQIEIEKIVRSTTVSARLKKRATIILRAIDGKSNSEIARELRVRPATCSKWRMRFCNSLAHLEAAAQTGDAKSLRQKLCKVLDNAPRLGRPRTFQPEAVAQIMQTACQKPQEHSFEASHWTCSLLAKRFCARSKSNCRQKLPVSHL